MDDALDALRQLLRGHPEITLRPVATQAEVTAFEQRHGIELPAAYRRFLLEVCGGIDVDDEPQVYGLDSVELASSGTLAAPFWYSDGETEALRAALDEVPAGGVLDHPAIVALQKEGMPDGCIVVADMSSEMSALVVSGEQRGRMWRLGDADVPETRKLYDASEPVEPIDFLAWIALWVPCFL